MDKPKIDLKGQRFCRLLVLEFIGNKIYSGKTRGFWKCQCDCGNFVEQATFQLRAGKVKSCGCLQKEVASRQGKKLKKHGLRHTKEYSCWANMIQRATNPNSLAFDIYSKRGICPLWKDSFEEFLNHIGRIPEGCDGYSIERVDNTIGYFPGMLNGWIGVCNLETNQDVVTIKVV